MYGPIVKIHKYKVREYYCEVYAYVQKRLLTQQNKNH